MSEKDAHWFRSIVGSSIVSVVPTGVDTEQYRCDQPAGDDNPHDSDQNIPDGSRRIVKVLPAQAGLTISRVPPTKVGGSLGSADPDRGLIVFLGSMDWEANVDGVVHFCEAILPLVRERIPAARLRIVGRNPTIAIRRLASATVEVTGTVESVLPHLRQAVVVVVPLRIGGGTRLKILEAMAMGKAIVSTNIGAEGLNLKDGREILLADRPSDFAEAIVRLMQNDRQRLRLEEKAAALARIHGWEGPAALFHQVLTGVLNERRFNNARSITSEMRWT